MSKTIMALSGETHMADVAMAPSFPETKHKHLALTDACPFWARWKKSGKGIGGGRGGQTSLLTPEPHPNLLRRVKRTTGVNPFSDFKESPFCKGPPPPSLLHPCWGAKGKEEGGLCKKRKSLTPPKGFTPVVPSIPAHLGLS